MNIYDANMMQILKLETIELRKGSQVSLTNDTNGIYLIMESAHSADPANVTANLVAQATKKEEKQKKKREERRRKRIESINGLPIYNQECALAILRNTKIAQVIVASE